MQITNSCALLIALTCFGVGYCYAKEDNPIYFFDPDTKTALADNVTIVGSFPLGQIEEPDLKEGEISKNDEKRRITVAFRLENESPTTFNFYSIYADSMFTQNDYDPKSNCPKSEDGSHMVIEAGQSCLYLFTGTLLPASMLNKDSYITVSYHQNNHEIKNIRPWSAIATIVPSQKIYDFSQPQQITLKNIFPVEIELVKIEKKDGVYDGTNNDYLALEGVNEEKIEPDKTWELIIQPQEIFREYQTIRIEYKINDQIEKCYIGLTNAVPITALTKIGEPRQNSEKDTSYISEIYSYFLTKLPIFLSGIGIGAGAIGGGAAYYYKHDAEQSKKGIEMLQSELQHLEQSIAEIKSLPPPPPPPHLVFGISGCAEIVAPTAASIFQTPSKRALEEEAKRMAASQLISQIQQSGGAKSLRHISSNTPLSPEVAKRGSFVLKTDKTKKVRNHPPVKTNTRENSVTTGPRIVPTAPLPNDSETSHTTSGEEQPRQSSAIESSLSQRR